MGLILVCVVLFGLALRATPRLVLQIVEPRRSLVASLDASLGFTPRRG